MSAKERPPDLCDECGQKMSDCITFGCLCDICGTPALEHVLWIVELPHGAPHLPGPLCPGHQLDDLDIYTAQEDLS